MPISNADAQPRASVAETYELILEDLDYAISHAPDFSSTFYVSKIAAKALKSKVALYKRTTVLRLLWLEKYLILMKEN